MLYSQNVYTEHAAGGKRGGGRENTFLALRPRGLWENGFTPLLLLRSGANLKTFISGISPLRSLSRPPAVTPREKGGRSKLRRREEALNGMPRTPPMEPRLFPLRYLALLYYVFDTF